jgi:hypothetical protein
MRKNPDLAGALALVLTLISAATLSACNSSEAAKKQIEADWIHDTGPEDTAPAPNTAQPNSPPPTPTPTPTPTQSPTPTPSPSPPTIPVSELYEGDAAFAPYVEKFVADAALQGVDLVAEMRADPVVIQMGSLDYLGSGVIGLCETGYGGRTVTLDPDFWGRISDTQDELLMHHELGHCILYRPHRSTLLSTGREASIMNPIIMSSSTYQGNYAYYQNELFTYWTAQTSARTASPEEGGPAQHICDINEIH